MAILGIFSVVLAIFLGALGANHGIAVETFLFGLVIFGVGIHYIDSRYRHHLWPGVVVFTGIAMMLGDVVTKLIPLMF
jgi:hypothetical protein